MGQFTKWAMAAIAIVALHRVALQAQSPPPKRNALEQRALEFVPSDADFAAILDLTQLRGPWLGGKTFPIDALLDEHLGKEGLRVGVYDPKSLGASIAAIDRLVIVGHMEPEWIIPMHAMAAHFSRPPQAEQVLSSALGAYEAFDLQGRKCFRSTGAPLAAHFTDDGWLVLAPSEALERIVIAAPGGAARATLEHLPTGSATSVALVRDAAWCDGLVNSLRDVPYDQFSPSVASLVRFLRCAEHFERAGASLNTKPFQMRAALRCTTAPGAKETLDRGQKLWAASIENVIERYRVATVKGLAQSAGEAEARIKQAEQKLGVARNLAPQLHDRDIRFETKHEGEAVMIVAILLPEVDRLFESFRLGVPPQ